MYFFFFEINSLSSTELAELVKSRALGAAFNSPNHQTVPRCLPGTRTEVLKAIKDCIDGEKSKQICWLYGLAGSGKYTVNLTLADYYADERRLAGSFFFSKKDPELDNFNHFVATLASQLIVSFPNLKALLQEALERDPTLIRQSFRFQFEKLILDPLKKITLSGPPMVIIIDSLDDCKDSESVKEFLKLIGAAVEGGKFPFRLLIGSRSEAYLQLTFDGFAKKKLASILCLDNYAVEDDIRAFLRHRLADVHADRQLAVAQPWPSNDELKILLATSGQLFLHAVAIVEFINKPKENPVRQLEIVLKGKRQKKATVFTSLDNFYNAVISRLPFDEHTRDVVGTISLLREPLSLNELEKLLKLKKGESRQTLSGWQSLISNTSDQKDSSKPVQLVHTPLWQYLTDKKRSAEFSIDAALQHSQVTVRCIELMTKEFGLVVLVGNTKKPSPAVLYACRHWDYHLTHSVLGPALRDSLKVIKFRTLVGWFKTLRQAGELNRITSALKRVREWVKV